MIEHCNCGGTYIYYTMAKKLCAVCDKCGGSPRTRKYEWKKTKLCMQLFVDGYYTASIAHEALASLMVKLEQEDQMERCQCYSCLDGPYD